MPDSTTPLSGPMYSPDHDSSFVGSMTDSSYVCSKATDFETDSPDSGHKEMTSDGLSLSLVKADGMYWQQLAPNQGVAYSSPENYIVDPAAQFADVTGNPFANGFNDGFGDFYAHGATEDELKIITPMPPQDASGNRLELKLSKTPKIAPPPEFRNSKSYRDSQISQQSTDSTSSQDMNLFLKGDSDYFSTTTSVSSSQTNDKGVSPHGTNGNGTLLNNLPNTSAHSPMNSVNGHSPMSTMDMGSQIICQTGSVKMSSSMASSMTSADFDNGMNEAQGHDNKCSTLNTALVKSTLRLELKKEGSPIVDRDQEQNKLSTPGCDASPRSGLRDDYVTETCHIQEVQMKIKAPPPPPPPRKLDSLPFENFEQMKV